MDNLISIIVPIYNVEPYLKECIDSIINQTYKNLEIILVDDGSTDGSEKICDEYAKKDNRIIVIHQENKGLVGARKAGLAISNGDYIGYVDGDDWIEPEMYEHMLLEMLQTSADFVDSGFIKQGNSKKTDCIHNILKGKSSITINVNEDTRYKIIKNLLLDNTSASYYVTTSICSKLIKKDIFKKAQQNVDTSIIYGEDLICTLYLLEFSNKIVYTGKYHYNYRFREGSITKQNDLIRTIPQLIQMMNGIYKFFDEFDYNYTYKQLANHRVTNSILIHNNKLQNNILKRYPIYKLSNEFIFNNKNIILYGAGDVGISYYNHHKDDINIVYWADRNYQNLTNYPIKIESPDNILNYDFDYLLIAVLHESLASSIKQDLISKGIPEEKILWSEPQSTLDWLL